MAMVPTVEWKELTYPVGYVAKLFKDPSGPDRFVAVVRDSMFSAKETLFRFTMSGAEWTKLSEPFDRWFFDWIVPTSNSSLLYMYDQDKLYRSVDAGRSWTVLEPSWPKYKTRPAPIVSIAPNLSNPDHLLIATMWVDGIFRSQDQGSTWSPSDQGIEWGTDKSVRVYHVPGHANGFLAVTFKGIYVSGNGGESWSLVKKRSWNPYDVQLTFAASRMAYVLYGTEPTQLEKLRLPLSVEDVEELLRAGVTPQRMATLTEEYRVGFELTGEVGERLKKAGADAVVMEVVEKAGLEFARKKPKLITGKDGAEMVLIPTGEFWMGCNEEMDQECDDDEKPGRKVYLDAFYIDKYEVTVAQYRQCVQAGGCSIDDFSEYCNWGKGERENHPVNCVDWNQAKTYCEWAGKRLPTEAEWEKAARGTDGRKYPWGNRWDSSKTNAENRVSKTSSVGSFPAGVSLDGVHDMAGNVEEWVQDWYDRDYDKRSVSQNPQGPDSGSVKVLRGGSWGVDPGLARVSVRRRVGPRLRHLGLGVRCAR